MRRRLVTLVIVAAVGGMSAIAWFLLTSASGHGSLGVQFERKSPSSIDEVSECIEHGKETAFPGFDYLSTPRTYTTHVYRDYIDQDGSKISMSQKAGHTIVEFRSSRSISSLERDLLEWCSDTPGTTWTPRRLR